MRRVRCGRSMAKQVAAASGRNGVAPTFVSGAVVDVAATFCGCDRCCFASVGCALRKEPTLSTLVHATLLWWAPGHDGVGSRLHILERWTRSEVAFKTCQHIALLAKYAHFFAVEDQLDGVRAEKLDAVLGFLVDGNRKRGFIVEDSKAVVKICFVCKLSLQVRCIDERAAFRHLQVCPQGCCMEVYGGSIVCPIKAMLNESTYITE